MTENPKNPGKITPDDEEAVSSEVLDETEDSVPQSAFYSPDDPIASPEGDIPPEALFSPDGPLRIDEPEEGVVTRLSGRPTRSMDKPRSLTWRVRLTADLLEALSRDLKERGLEALKIHPKSERMDAVLRSFIAGYLVGQMDDEGTGS